MNPRYQPFIWTGAAIVVGALLVLAIRGVGDGDPVPAAQPAAVAAASGVQAATSAAAPAAAAEILPWAQGPATAARTPSSAVATAGALPANPVAAVGAIEAATAIATIRTQSQHNVKMVDNLLRELDELEKSGQVSPDMKIDALRDNLAVAKRAQVLALELAESTQQPDSPARQQRTASIIEELQQLQDQLRYDVASGALPDAGRTP